jgi:hypothetical protein
VDDNGDGGECGGGGGCGGVVCPDYLVAACTDVRGEQACDARRLNGAHGWAIPNGPEAAPDRESILAGENGWEHDRTVAVAAWEPAVLVAKTGKKYNTPSKDLRGARTRRTRRKPRAAPVAGGDGELSGPVGAQ